jgi:hypothetical protein
MGLLDTFVGAAKGYVLSGGNPLAAFTSGVSADQQAKQQKKLQRRFAQQQAQEAELMAMDLGVGTTRPTYVDPYKDQLVVNAGNGGGEGFFSTVRSGLREIGGFVSDAFSTGIPQLLGINRPRGVQQQPAITTVTNVGAQESQGSGSIQAGMGAALPSIINAGRQLLKNPLAQFGIGTAAGGFASLIGPDGRKLRVTRKMKSQARMVVNLAQGNISVAADILGISEDMLVAILLKRFRNDGPVVTKAALRKTKQTIRRLHNMQDVLKSITPTPAGRRRATMKRASTITQIKN